MGIHKFLQKHRETNNIERRPGSGRPTKITAPVKALAEQRMRDDDETTAVQLHALLLCHAIPQVSRCSWPDVQRQCELFFIVLFSDESFCDRCLAMNRFRTLRPFRLNGWGVSYTTEGRSVFVLFRKNGTIKLYCHTLYMWWQFRSLYIYRLQTCISNALKLQPSPYKYKL